METVTIPAGSFVAGTGDRQIEWLVQHTNWAQGWVEKGFFAREQPQHTLYLPAYAIGIYPVTVGEFRLFVDAGSYSNRDYWTDSGWEWREANNVDRPAFWDEALWTGDPRLPVVGVSWYETTAYGRWLSNSLGKRCRLPSEMEWEKAARGEDGRLYPWGNLFERGKCNTRAAAIHHTVPVGSYSPSGDSPYGCSDMVGNVSEWVLSKFVPYPYVAGDGRENHQGTAERITRGGSWHSPDFRARITSRGMNDPGFRDNDLGFRVVVVA